MHNAIRRNHMLTNRRLKAKGKSRERECIAIARDLEANKLINTSGDLAPEALAIRSCKLVEEGFVILGVGNGEIVDPNDYKKKRAVALESEDAGFAPELRKAVVFEELGVGLLSEMSALASTFKRHFQLAHELLTCPLVVLFEAFHLLTVKVGVAQRCLRESLDDVDAFQLDVEGCNKQKEDADRRGFGSCRKGFLKVNFGSLTVAAEYPARFASFRGSVVVELVGEDPLGLADEHVLGARDEVKGIVRYVALELFDASRAPHFFIRAAVDALVVLGWRQSNRSSSTFARSSESFSKSVTCITVASSPRGSKTWPAELRRGDGGLDADAVGLLVVDDWATGGSRAVDIGMVDVPSIGGCCLRGKTVARSARHKRTSDALIDFGGDRLVKLDVAEADCSEAINVEQVNEVAAAALVDAEVNTFCNTWCELAGLLYFAALRAGLHLAERHVRDGRAGASGNKGVVDGHNL
eukprot:4535641-Pleurochrysis_carterae.AAC.6